MFGLSGISSGGLHCSSGLGFPRLQCVRALIARKRDNFFFFLI